MDVGGSDNSILTSTFGNFFLPHNETQQDSIAITMEWITMGINALIVGTLLIQHEGISRVHRHLDLDSPRVHNLFQFYFFLALMFSLSSIDLYHFKDPSTSLSNAIASAISLFITLAFIIKSYTSGPLNSYDTLESQLLLSSDPLPVVSIMSTPTSVTKPISYNLRSAVDSKDISPLSSHSNRYISTSQDSQKFSHVKTPILATLLSADSVLANALSTPIPAWRYSLPILIAMFYVASQVIYNVSMIKTNVYIRHRQLIVTNTANLILSIFILLTMTLGDDYISLIHFTRMTVLNYVICSMLTLLSAVALIYHFMTSTNRQPLSVQVYNSIDSP